MMAAIKWRRIFDFFRLMVGQFILGILADIHLLCPPDGFHADAEELGDLGEAAAFLVAHAAHLVPLCGGEGRGTTSNASALLRSLQPLASAL